MNYKIERLSELDSSYLGQVTKIFGESFGHMFSGFTKDIDKLAKCFGESFVREIVYMTLSGQGSAFIMEYSTRYNISI